MRIESIDARPLAIPFKLAFKHSAAERRMTQTLWVSAKSGNRTGHGEGCPREYVTAENLDSALSFVNRHRHAWQESIGDLHDLNAWIDTHETEIDRNPAAWCAVELALLDLLAQANDSSIEALLELPPLAGRFLYSAVLGDSSAEQFEVQLERYRKLGFESYKIKLAGDIERDRQKVQALQKWGIGAPQVRADANNLWNNAESALAYLRTLAYPFCALEEPLRVGDYEGMRYLAAALDTRIILDESLTRSGQIVSLVDTPHWILNLRVSKLGGLLRSLRVLDAARKSGLDIIVGAHVGESSLLTRAALTVAHTAADSLVAQEGAFGTHLLEYDVVASPLMFGAQGAMPIDSECFDRPGWGLAVRGEAI